MLLKIFKRSIRDFARVLTRSLFVTTIHQSADRSADGGNIAKTRTRDRVFGVEKRVIENYIVEHL